MKNTHRSRLTLRASLLLVGLGIGLPATVNAQRAPEAVVQSVEKLVQQGKMTEAANLVDGLLSSYPHDTALKQLKSEIAKSAPANAPVSLPPATQGPSASETAAWLEQNRDKWSRHYTLYSRRPNGSTDVTAESTGCLNCTYDSISGSLSIKIWTRTRWGRDLVIDNLKDVKLSIADLSPTIALQPYDFSTEAAGQPGMRGVGTWFRVSIRSANDKGIVLASQKASYIKNSDGSAKLELDDKKIGIIENQYPVTGDGPTAAVWLQRWSGAKQSNPKEIVIEIEDENYARRFANAVSHLIKLHGGKSDTLFK